MSISTTMRVRPPEERDAIRRETSWERLEEPPTLTPEQIGVIERGDQCPHCHGSGEVRLDARGVTTDITVSSYLSVHCPCSFVRWLSKDWRIVPERFRDARLSTLVPRSKRQAEILELLRQRPDDSYYFSGPPGSGKTHLSYALYRHILVGNLRDARNCDYSPHIWRVTASVLLHQHVAAETDREAPTPEVTERMITTAARKGLRPIIFLDEIDKFPASDFKLGRLGEIIDAIYAAKGQIVATANKDAASLAKRWGDPDVVGTILRRIGSDGGHTLSFA
ncbi:MAG TPA: ATP-binding protein [Acidobacteriaceae bacterium]